jgi:hypothetical protein
VRNEGASPPGSEARQALFFLHIARTGGTSLMQFLDRQFPADAICPAHKKPEFAELERQNKLLGYLFYRAISRPICRGGSTRRAA